MRPAILNRPLVPSRTGDDCAVLCDSEDAVSEVRPMREIFPKTMNLRAGLESPWSGSGYFTEDVKAMKKARPFPLTAIIQVSAISVQSFLHLSLSATTARP